MNRRNFLQTLAAGGCALPGGARTAARRPNIVVILADDMGFSDLACYGSEIDTPNLNRLAQRGIRFTQFYNNARCCPTRSSLLTGLYAHQGAIGHMTGDYNLPAYRGDLSPNAVTIAEALRPAGYHTLMAGKWHVTPVGEKYRYNWPLQRGFEKYYGTILGAGSYYDPVTLVRDNTPIQADRKDYYYTDAITENASAYIGEYARKRDPFFLYVAYTASHWPLHALPEDIAKYRERYRSGWDALRAQRHRRQIETGMVHRQWPLTPRDPRVPAWEAEPNKDWQALRMAVYAAQIDRMDRGVGRVLAALKDSGAEDNTLVLFLADNGGCAEELKVGAKAQYIPERTRDGRGIRVGNDPSIAPGPEDTYASYGVGWANASNTPFRLYKHWVHEGGISTPLIARWPAAIRQSGAITQQYGHIIDIMATCVDVAGARYPARHGDHQITPLEGKSLLPVLTGGKRPAPDIYWEHEGNRAVREDAWKLVSRFPEEWELYNLEADRTEMNNVAGRHPDIASRLKAKWEVWAERVGVKPWEEIRKRQGNT